MRTCLLGLVLAALSLAAFRPVRAAASNSLATAAPAPKAACREWRRLSAPGERAAPELLDLCAVGNGLFAVGTRGTFCRIRAGRLEPIPSPTKLRLNVVWGRSGREVYAAGENGIVLRFDGRKLHLVGTPVATFPGLREFGRPAVRPVLLEHVWASSPRDVYACCPGLLLHFDGREWTPVEIGAGGVAIRTMTVTGRDMIYPDVGPIWGTSPHDVWVGRRVVDRNSRMRPPHPPTGILVPPPTPEYHVAHFNGSRWEDAGPVIQPESWMNAGGGRLHPQIAAPSPNAVFTRFGNVIRRWVGGRWREIAVLPPRDPVYWPSWTAAGNNRALVQTFDDLRMWDGSRWLTVEPTPTMGGRAQAIALTEDGVAALLDSRDHNLVIGRIRVSSR